jgi:hypothetical protein
MAEAQLVVRLVKPQMLMMSLMSIWKRRVS